MVRIEIDGAALDIVIQCREGAAYDEIIVEVEDPEGTMTMIRLALEELR